MAKTNFMRYGYEWRGGTSAIEIEFYMIRQGKNLFEHYRALHSLLWEDEHNKWSDLALREFTDCMEFRKRGMVGLLGPGSSGKTYYASKFVLSHYYVYPEETTALLTTTTVQKLDLGILGEVKKLHKQAKARWDDLPGTALDYKRCIITDRSEDGDTRDFRNGIIGIACYKGEHWVGIGPFVGIKNKWVFLVADECSLMDISYLRATSNLDKNERFFFIPIANPVNGEHSPMGQSCEPELGWGSVRDITKTTIWVTKYAKGKCINFVGTDSPNFGGNRHYPFLIDQERIDSTLRFYGPHSEEFNAMCLGIMRPGEDSQRVLTKQLCTIHKAYDKAVWKGVNRTKVFSVDAAYGGDRCVGGWIEFGEDVDGKQIVRVEKPHVIKIGMKRGAEPEDEIAEHVRDECLRESIPVENIFYDSTGRGTLGAAFARVFGHVIPVPVEFGGRPSQRPVRLDLYVVDQHTHQRRLKRADEEYQKRVSEFWFAVRWLVESEQLRELPESVANEFFMREFIFVGGNKRDVEPKDKTKQRIGRSPDEADWLATAVEGARQRGLQISKLGADKFTEASGKSWLAELNERHRKLIASMRLKTAA